MSDLDLGSTIRGYIAGQKVFSRYTLKNILGRGGMGVVWLARDEELEREVALKFLPEIVALDKESVTELKRETRRNLELTHAHIVRIHDFVQDASAAAISMEYVDGPSLSALKTKQPGGVFPLEKLQRWVRQLGEALSHAHEQAQVVHRDLKPANLMINSRGDLKIADFGIATSISDSVSRVSRQVGSSGTPVYMSPQQMMGEKPAVTDDIYALGATLYELLTGKPPFYTGNVLMQVTNKVPPTMAARREELGVTNAEAIPAAWEATVAACLAKEPGERPQSMAAALARLNGEVLEKRAPNTRAVAEMERAAVARPVAAVVEETGPTPKRSRGGVFAVAAIVTILLAAAGYYFGVHAPEQRRVAAEQQRVADEKRWQEERLANERRVAEERLANERRLADQQREEARKAAELRQAQEAARAVVLTRIAELTPRADRAAKEKLDADVLVYAGAAPAADRSFVEERWSAAKNAWAEANRPASITIQTEPSDAEIRMGETVRRSPTLMQDIPPGKVRFSVAKAGYRPKELEFDLKPGQAFETPVLKLEEIVFPFKIATRMPGVRFRISNTVGTIREGSLPAELSLPAGRYTVVYTREKYPARNESLVVGEGSPAELTVDMTGPSLTVASEPAGAEVFMQGRRLGITPLTLPDLSPGSYPVELRLRDHEGLQRSLVVTPETRSETVTSTLKKFPNGLVRPDFSKGPRKLVVASKTHSRGSMLLLSVDSTIYDDMEVELTELASNGEVRRIVSKVLRQEAGKDSEAYTLAAGSVLEFARAGTGWKPTLRNGQLRNGESAADLLRYFQPSLPSLTLWDAKWWPTADTPVGGVWNVPVARPFPFVNFPDVSGRMTGRLVNLQRTDDEYWADVEYSFKVEGDGGKESYHGTVNCRVDLGRGFISRLASNITRTGAVKVVIVSETTARPPASSGSR